MIIFLYGEDSFRSREKLRAIRDRYLQSPGGEVNFLRLAPPELTYAAYEQAAYAVPFLAKTRLVILENLLSAKAEAERIIESLSEVPSSTVLVIWEDGVPDRRTKIFGALKKAAQVEEFPLLGENELRRWITDRVENLGGEITPLVTDLLARSVGPNLWRLSGEIEKLVNYSSEVTAESVELLVEASESDDVFALVDAVGEGKARAALSHAHAILQAGRGELYLLAMLSRQFRLIAQVGHLKRQAQSEAQIAKRLGLHPFVVRKVAAQTKGFDPSDVKEAYRLLREADLKLKTTAQEGAVVVDLLIGELSRISSRASARP